MAFASKAGVHDLRGHLYGLLRQGVEEPGEGRDQIPVARRLREHGGLDPHRVGAGHIEDLLVRPRGRPSRAPLVRYYSLQYQAASWDRPRRVIAKVEHQLGEREPVLI